MAQVSRPVAHTGGHGLFIIGAVLYLAFVGLFLWQTAEFVNWLFPDDQIIYRVITVTTFDVMALLWASIDTFYRFATRASHGLVKWAWTISFIASMVASIFYMVLQSMTRLDFTPDATYVNIGYGIVILVTVLQILFLTFFIRQEWMARHPKMQDYEYDALPPVQVQPIAAPVQPKVLTRPRQSIDTRPVKQLPRARKFTPRTLPEVREVGKASGPLAEAEPETEKIAVPVKKGNGPYKVNHQRAKIHLND